MRSNCIRDRNCAECDFEQECIVRRTMYSKFDRKPAFVNTGDSVGYVLECENYEEIFKAEDLMNFQLILFGKTIVYFSQFLQAIYQLGSAGIGKEHSRYRLISIRNTIGKEIMETLMGCEIDSVDIMDQYFDTAYAIIGHMRDYTDKMTEETHLNISLLATAAEGVTGNFAQYDSQNLGKNFSAC